MLPFGAGDRIRDYFDKYRSSQTHLNGIIESLYSGQDELRRDNAAIVGEQQRLWETNGRLRQYLYMGQQLDAKLVERIAAIEATDPDAGDRARARTSCSTSARRSRTSPPSSRSASRATSRSTSCARTTSS